MKNLLIILSITIVIGNSYSQNLKFGLKGGINSTSLIGSDADNLEGRFNYHAGVVFNINVNENFSIQPEAVYSSQGFEDDLNGILVDGQLDYINVPILIDYKIISNLSIQGGPQIGILTVDEAEPENLASMDIGAETVDISGVFGAQYITPIDVFVQARYAIGLTDVVDGLNGKNSVLSLSLGYFF